MLTPQHNPTHPPPTTGEIGFSGALEELSSSLFNGKLPPAWARLNPATEKPLGPWMAWFTRRHEQYKVGGPFF